MAACCTANLPSNLPEGHSTTDTRFWGTVDRTGGCWIWTASVTNQGVGQYRLVGGWLRRIAEHGCSCSARRRSAASATRAGIRISSAHRGLHPGPVRRDMESLARDAAQARSAAPDPRPRRAVAPRRALCRSGRAHPAPRDYGVEGSSALSLTRRSFGRNCHRSPAGSATIKIALRTPSAGASTVGRLSANAVIAPSIQPVTNQRETAAIRLVLMGGQWRTARRGGNSQFVPIPRQRVPISVVPAAERESADRRGRC
jgi:hypothetical protein